MAAQVRGSGGEIAQYLTTLADAMRSGGVQIRAGDRAVGLHLDDQVTMELRAEAGNGQTNRIALMISWEVKSPPPPAPKLHISHLQTAGQNAAEEQKASPASDEGESAVPEAGV